jgi:hypothetical protein
MRLPRPAGPFGQLAALRDPGAQPLPPGMGRGANRSAGTSPRLLRARTVAWGLAQHRQLGANHGRPFGHSALARHRRPPWATRVSGSPQHVSRRTILSWPLCLRSKRPTPESLTKGGWGMLPAGTHTVVRTSLPSRGRAGRSRLTDGIFLVHSTSLAWRVSRGLRTASRARHSWLNLVRFLWRPDRSTGSRRGGG